MRSIVTIYDELVEGGLLRTYVLLLHLVIVGTGDVAGDGLAEQVGPQVGVWLLLLAPTGCSSRGSD